MSSYIRTLLLLLWKNTIQMRRNWKNTAFEIGVPIFLIYIICAMYSVSLTTTVEIPDALNSDTEMIIPSIHLLPSFLQASELQLGLVSPDKEQVMTVLDTLYPGLPSLNIPPLSKFIRKFDSTEAIDLACHGNDSLGLFGALVLERNDDGGWKTSIRMNATSTLKLPGQGTNALDTLAAGMKEPEGPNEKLLFRNVVRRVDEVEIKAPGFIPLQMMAQSLVFHQSGATPLVTEATPKTMCKWFNTLILSAQVKWGDFGLTGPEDCEPNVDANTAAWNAFWYTKLSEPSEMYTTLFPIPAHTKREDPMEQSITMYMLYIWILPLARFVRGVVLEKETRVRESMLMMGLRLSTLLLSWLVTYSILCFFILTVATVKFKAVLFSNSPESLIFVYLLTLVCSIFAFGILASTFFDRSKTATATTPLMLFALTAPYLPHNTPSTHSPILLFLKSLTPFSSTTNFFLGMKTFFELNSSEGGMSWDRIHQSTPGGMSIFDSIFYMLMDTALYLILGWYFDHVLPKEFGIRYKWYFPLQSSYWISEVRTQKDALDIQEKQGLLNPAEEISSSGVEGKYIEALSNSNMQKVALQKCISVQGLGKVFDSSKVAVQDLNLEMCEGEIFGLLGENGAGKSTTINILTGLLGPTSGNAFIYGHSIKDEMDSIRQFIGVCQQHDVLFEKLTVREHLVIFARLKGVSNDKVEAMVQSQLTEVGLLEKKDCIADTLSGGQKRKLSVAIALLGDSKVVFLDEPTSGMDPYSRRFTWNILQKNREGRIMILTTHSMDEADILSSRIAIMAHGELQCCGSSMFLKKTFGVGYQLTFVKKSPKTFQSSSVIKFLRSFISQVKVEKDSEVEIIFRLPSACSSDFPSFFTALEQEKEELGIASYGISVTTMEEVFVQVAQNHVANNESRAISAPKPRTPAASYVHRHASSFDQFRGLLLKRKRTGVRDRRVLFGQFFIPLVFLFVMMHTYSTMADENPEVIYALKAEWKDPVSIPFVIDKTIVEKKEVFVDWFSNGIPRIDSKIQVPQATNITTSFGTPDVGLAQYLLDTAPRRDPPAYASVALSQRNGTTAHSEITMNVLTNATATDGLILTLKLLAEGICKSSNGNNCEIELHSHALPNTAAVSTAIQSLVGFLISVSIMLTFSTITTNFVSVVVKEQEGGMKHLQFLSGVTIPAYWLANFFWDSFMMVVTQIIILGMLAFYNFESIMHTDRFLGITTAFGLYTMSILPFLYVFSFLFKSHSSSQSYLSYVNLTQILLMTISFVTSNIPLACVYNAKYKPYFQWLPGYALGDTLLEITTLEMAGWRKNCVKMNTANIDADAIVEILSNLSKMMSGEEKISLWDWDVAGRNMWTMALSAVVYFCITMLIESLYSMPSVRKTFVDFMMQYSWRKKDRIAFSALPVLGEEDADVISERSRVVNSSIQVVADGSENDEEDVISLHHLRKVYHGGKVAVQDLTFGIPKGGCFGFLGINGAGKSSTMNMLTGEIVPTSGDAWLNNCHIAKQQMKARQWTGYCPQHSALWELLTSREHLELFAVLKGVPHKNVDDVVEAMLARMDLLEFSDVLASKLSGGNKRKLSVGIAMIGKPPIVFLDEPSTGVDPVSRRYMWTVIEQVSTTLKESTVILTTHSMEEAQAVCTMATIMVDGALKCWGTIQHLKHRYGRGLICEIKLTPSTPASIREFIQSIQSHVTSSQLTDEEIRTICNAEGRADRFSRMHQENSSGWMLQQSLATEGTVDDIEFSEWWLGQEMAEQLESSLREVFPTVRELEQHGQYFKYEVPFGDENNKHLGEIFGAIERLKDSANIGEYSVTQPSLEEIFNQFASGQTAETTRPQSVHFNIPT